MGMVTIFKEEEDESKQKWRVGWELKSNEHGWEEGAWKGPWFDCYGGSIVFEETGCLCMLLFILTLKRTGICLLSIILQVY